ncbi:unnamed protein product [Rhodiola kirilowii]
MGVHGLWELLAPVGRRVSVENLSGKRLAIDASIWMVQFMKAMRDESGEMVRNAHLLGFFRRICKLLFLRTKPVFVFDGATPALKRRTVLARRRQRENAQAKIRKTAERLLLNHLKEVNLKRLAEDLKSQRSDDGGKGKSVLVDQMDILEKNLNHMSASYNQEKLDEMLAASLAAEDGRTFIGDESASAAGISLEEEKNGDEEQEELVLPTIQGDVDPNVLSSLPPSMQLDLLAQMRERLMAENRQKYQKVKKAPEKFSALQIQSYLKTVAFRREIDEVQKSAGTRGVGGLKTSKIASETSREFIFSSSYAGNKELLASSRMEKTLNNKEKVASELLSSPSLLGHKPTESNNVSEGVMNESGEVSHENVETYLDERGCVRVSRLRALGIRMTRDLQRNLDMMKEMEQTNSNVEATGKLDSSSISQDFSTGSSLLDSSIMQTNSDSGVVMDHSLGSVGPSTSADKTLFQISFDSGFEENDLDGDDEIFKSLVAGKPLVITEADSEFCSQPSNASDSGCEWEEGTVEGNTDSKYVNEAQMKCESSLKGVINDESGVEWADGVSEVAQETAFQFVEHAKAASRGDLEEESQLQEAIQRSLQDAQATRLEDVSPKTIHMFSINEVAQLSPDRNEVPESSLLDQRDQNEILFSCESVDARSQDIAGGRSVLPAATEKLPAILEEQVHEYCDGQRQPTSDYDPMEVVFGVGGNAVDNTPNFKTSTSPENNEANLGVNLVDSTPDNSKSAPESTNSMNDLSSLFGIPPVQEISIVADSNISFLEGTEPDVSKREKMDKFGVHELNVAQREELEASLVDELAVLNKERLNLGNEQKKLERNAEGVSGEMFAECQELLQMFGLPYIIAPMEAEAQCAFLEQAGLVDGVVTDDSDVFLFGAQSVYKNIFDNRKYVETYFMKDIERELGMSREKLIRMAMLLGSDYTEGVSGIGIVNAIEVLNAFPEDEGLCKFREWIESPDPTIFYKKKDTIVNKEGSTSRKKGRTPTKKGLRKHGEDASCSVSALDQDDSRHLDEGTVDDVQELKQIFMDKHRNISKNWHVPSSFPSDAIISAYISPKVDMSTEPFSHGRPDHPVLRKLCLERFGWSYQKTDELLLPVLKEYNKHETQLRLEAFYTFNEKFAKIRSKRIKKAVKGITGKNSLDDDVQRVSESNKGKDSRDHEKAAGDKCIIEGGSMGNEVSPLVGKSLKVSSKRKGAKESESIEKVNVESPVSAKDRHNVRKASSVIERGIEGGSATGKLSRKRSKLSDYADMSAGEASSEKKPSVDIHERPQKLRRSSRNRKPVNYTSEVETDDMNMSTENIEESCAGEEHVNLASACCPQDLSQLDTDQICTPLAINDPGDYLKMGGGFCVDEED